MSNPQVRTRDVHYEALGGEAVVYDRLSDRVHRLNPVLTVIWRAADGTRSAHELAEMVSSTLNVACGTAAVELGLQELRDSNLLEGGVDSSELRPSRRELARRLTEAGLAASALPVLTSALAPAPAMARSFDRDHHKVQDDSFEDRDR